MNRIVEFFNQTIQGLRLAIQRFPMAFSALVGLNGVVWYLIWLDASPSLWLEKSVFVLIFAAVIGVAAQLWVERFIEVKQAWLKAYGADILSVIGYTLIIAGAPSINLSVGIRTVVAVFATIAIGLYFPSHKSKHDFNAVAMVSFTSFFTSVLYAAVLVAGVSSIIAAVDILLFNVNEDVYAYLISVIVILFAPNYFLSLVPKFHSNVEAEVKFREEREAYPKILYILVSYIAIPLVIAYTLVLVAYFVRIVITLSWPVGQLGPLVLGYGLAGLVLYVLASRLENAFARFYSLWFPRVLIPIVLMQLVSVGIRLNAYSFTESRYYLLLFGIYFLVIGLVLSFKRTQANRWIAVLAAAFALLSIVPPIDAFSVSKQAQITRLTEFLEAENMLVDGKIVPNANASLNSRKEITSILDYLYWLDYTDDLDYLPENFELYRDFTSVFGFDMSYGQPIDEMYFFASVDRRNLLVEGTYDAWLWIDLSRYQENQLKKYPLTYNSKEYIVSFERQNVNEEILMISLDQETLLEVNLYEEVSAIRSNLELRKNVYSVEELSRTFETNQLKATVIFMMISLQEGSNAGADYEVLVTIDFVE